MNTWLPYILLAGGFALLVHGAHWLVTGASTVARRLGVSDLVVGLTVVAFGTSAPELVVNLFARCRDTPTWPSATSSAPTRSTSS